MWDVFLAGGPMMWPLLACSVAALAVVLERCWFWRKLGLARDASQAAKLLREGRPGEGCQGLVAAMLNAGLAAPPGKSGKAMEVVALAGVARMRKGMNILDTIITAAPMLGIMGTVLGIISSFDMLGASGVGDPKAVISGIAQALLTTAFGLGIAVFVIFPYNYFNARIEAALDLLEAYADRLEITLACGSGDIPDAPAKS